jgi:hypothetical protein
LKWEGRMDLYWVVTSQRGCGRSTPTGSPWVQAPEVTGAPNLWPFDGGNHVEVEATDGGQMCFQACFIKKKNHLAAFLINFIQLENLILFWGKNPDFQEIWPDSSSSQLSVPWTQ